MDRRFSLKTEIIDLPYCSVEYPGRVPRNFNSYLTNYPLELD